MLPLEEIDAVLFDADDTLFRVAGSVGQIYTKVLAEFGHQVPASEIDKRLPSTWNKIQQQYLNAENDYLTSPERERAVWREFSRMLYQAVDASINLDQVYDAVYDAFSRGSSRTLNPGVVEFVAQLKSKKLITGVLSNNDNRVTRVIQELNIAQHFDHILPTATLGFKKPSLKCFARAAEIVGIPAARILYIGDHLDQDYRAATAAGWKAVWYNHSGKPVPEDVRHAVECFVKARERL